MRNAEAVGTSLQAYDLPSDFELLKKESKTVNNENGQRFTNLLKSLHKLGAPEIIRLSM